MLKVGSKVKLNVSVPEGEIIKMRMDEDGVITYLMSWSNGDSAQERWFLAEDLLIVE